MRALLTLSCLQFALNAQVVTLEWDANSESDLAGYKLYQGLTSGRYDIAIDVGNVTTNTVRGLTPGLTYWFVFTAYNTSGLESEPSNEVYYTVPDLWIPAPATNMRIQP